MEKDNSTEKHVLTYTCKTTVEIISDKFNKYTHQTSSINKPIEAKPTADTNTPFAALCRATHLLPFFHRSCR